MARWTGWLREAQTLNRAKIQLIEQGIQNAAIYKNTGTDAKIFTDVGTDFPDDILVQEGETRSNNSQEADRSTSTTRDTSLQRQLSGMSQGERPLGKRVQQPSRQRDEDIIEAEVFASIDTIERRLSTNQAICKRLRKTIEETLPKLREIFATIEELEGHPLI